MVTEPISWIGDFEGTGAWPTVNRHMVAALEKQGCAVLKNVHNIGNALTPIQVFSGYPVRFPNVRHALNISYTSWEFEQLPDEFIHELNRFDLNIAACEWTASAYRHSTARPAAACHHGFDPAEFHPQGAKADFQNLAGKKILLWAGGTDKRHGFDVALEVIKHLPDSYVLVAKQSVHYPEQVAQHERVLVLRQDFASLAPLYRSAYAFLHTARAVGFGLHVLEALACGCPVVTAPLPPLREYAEKLLLVFTDDETVSTGGSHHIYPEVRLQWITPAPEAYAKALLKYERVANTLNGYRNRAAARQMTWEQAAKNFIQRIHEFRTLPV
ncbi:MAG: glycosyltransferase family 4 protein [Anaerolineae bacterium]|nr:glycosyltransferase family 4 protein [Anaerolineae bacterium]